MIPHVTAFNTMSGCGDGSNYEDFKSGARKSERYLDNEWLWAMNYKKGHQIDTSLTAKEFSEVLWQHGQSEIIVVLGHGIESGKKIALKGNDFWEGSEFDVSFVSEGNWDNIPGSFILLTHCNAGKDVSGGVAKSARDEGARMTVGHAKTTSAHFSKYFAKNYAKYCQSDSGYNINQIAKKAYNDAKEDTKWSPKVLVYPGYNCFYHSKFSTNIIRYDHDYDYPLVSILKDTSIIVGPSTTGEVPYIYDDGAFLFLDVEVQNDQDRIKVEYRNQPGGTWNLINTYALDKESDYRGADLKSENIHCYLEDGSVVWGFVQVRITPLDGYITNFDYRLQVIAG